MLKFFEKLIPVMYVGVLCFLGWVLFFMPSAETPIDHGVQESNRTTAPDVLNLYTYLNGITSTKGRMVFDYSAELDTGAHLIVKHEKDFETRGSERTAVGTDTIAINNDNVVFDSGSYVKEDKHYIKTPTGYVVAPNFVMDAGNMNIGKFDEVLKLTDQDTVTEDGITCYKYTGTMMYSNMSNILRDFIYNQGISIADIENLQLNVDLFMTEKNIPYKMVVNFQNANCSFRCVDLPFQHGVLKGTFTLSFNAFNNVDTLSYPADMSSATEGTYILTDKLLKYTNAIGK